MTNTDFKLSSTWDVYYSRNDVENWNDRLVNVTSFSTVREFWAVYHHLALPSNLPAGCDYMIFRRGVAPLWENKENHDGGRWSFQMRKNESKINLDDKWLETLLALIGEQLSTKSTQVNGAIVQSRRQKDRIAIWTTDCENHAKNVGTIYQNLVKPWSNLIFQPHANRSSTMKGQYTYSLSVDPFVIEEEERCV